MLQNVCDRLKYAAERVERQGWMKAGFRRYSGTGEVREPEIAGPACLIGSLIHDDEYQKFLTSGGRALPGFREAVKALGFDFTGDAYFWNDATGRTVEDVKQRINNAITATCAEPKETTNDSV